LYIGISKHPEKRWRQHKKNSEIGVKTPLCDAIRSFGFECIEKTVLLKTTSHMARIRERHYIAEHGTRVPFGYNLTEGGDGAINLPADVRTRMGAKNRGRMHTAETRAKMSASSRSKELMTPAVKAKISAATKGKKRSEETRRKISEIQRGKVRGPRDPIITAKVIESLRIHFLDPANRERARIQATGRKMTAEQNAKNSAAKTGHWQDPEYRAKMLIAFSGRPAQTEAQKAKRAEALRRDWESGMRREILKKAMSGRKWINNGAEHKQILPGEDIPDGWIRGMLKRAA
jgi:group I intron endonuclease